LEGWRGGGVEGWRGVGYIPSSHRSVSSLPTYDDTQGTSYPTAVHRELGLILKEIRVITDVIRDEDESSAVEADWKFAAMVLDRLCLVLFTIFVLLATVGVLVAAPHVIVK
jgi:nicotinic acetylcholine receptor